MYGYSEHISEDDILQRVSQAEIFQLVFGFLPEEGEKYISPFRVDNSPGCFFSRNDQGRLFFVDFGDFNRTHRDCFVSVREHYGMEHDEVMEFIYSQLKLGSIKPDMARINMMMNGSHKPKRDAAISITARKYTILDLKYWEDYGITESNLKEDEVLSVRTYRYFSSKRQRWFTVMPRGRCFALGDFQGRTKIYSPHAGGNDQKWLSTCTGNDVGGIKLLPDSGHLLIITKSYKDCRVLRNLGYNSVWVQSENMFPNRELLYNLTCRFNHVGIFFDNDPAGIHGSQKLRELIDSLATCSTFEISLSSSCKDPAEFYKKKGRDELISYMTQYLSYGEDTFHHTSKLA